MRKKAKLKSFAKELHHFMGFSRNSEEQMVRTLKLLKEAHNSWDKFGNKECPRRFYSGGRVDSINEYFISFALLNHDNFNGDDLNTEIDTAISNLEWSIQNGTY